MKTCALFGCDKPVTNWRISCCSRQHQRIYSGKKARGTENRPNKSNEERLAYHRKWSTEKQRRLKHATPSWGNPSKILSIYEEASKLTANTGIPHEVDHIVPIKGKNVCGLHNEFNLQVLTRTENRSKWIHFEESW